MSACVSFDRLPAELLEHIFGYLSEPRSLCRVACSCKVFSEAVNVNHHLWTRFYQRRWTYHYSKCPAMNQEGYKERHVRDGFAVQRVLDMAQSLTRERHYGLGTRCHDPRWIQLCEDVDSFDVLRLMARNKLQEFYPNRNTLTPLQQCIASQLVDTVHFRIVLQQFHSAVFNLVRSEDELLEEGVILISESLCNWNDVLNDNVATLSRIRACLDELASLIQRRSEEHMTAVDTVWLLKTILFEELGFVLDKDDPCINVERFCVAQVLRTRQGRPLPLAVLFKCILHRAGIRIDIIRLDDGRVLLGLPNEQVYVNVFDEENQRPTPWDLTAVKSLSRTDILSSLVVEIIACHAVVMMMPGAMRRGELNARRYIGLSRCAVLFRLLTTSQRVPKPFGLDRWLTRFRDPEIFHHYGLINERTMTRYSKKPFWFLLRWGFGQWFQARFRRN